MQLMLQSEPEEQPTPQLRLNRIGRSSEGKHWEQKRRQQQLSVAMMLKTVNGTSPVTSIHGQQNESRADMPIKVIAENVSHDTTSSKPVVEFIGLKTRKES